MAKDYPKTPVEVTDANFDTIIKKYPLIIIDCWASWCVPCRMLKPIIESLTGKYAGKVVFGELNVDENKEVTMKYDIMSIPTLLVFKKGKLIDRVIGALPEPVLKSKIKEYL